MFEDATLYNNIRKLIHSPPGEDAVTCLKARMDEMESNVLTLRKYAVESVQTKTRVDQHEIETDALKKRISQLESLVNDLLEKMSSNSVPEGDLLG